MAYSYSYDTDIAAATKIQVVAATKIQVGAELRFR
jgi:hypothetical protein